MVMTIYKTIIIEPDCFVEGNEWSLGGPLASVHTLKQQLPKPFLSVPSDLRHAFIPLLIPDWQSMCPQIGEPNGDQSNSFAEDWAAIQ